MIIRPLLECPRSPSDRPVVFETLEPGHNAANNESDYSVLIALLVVVVILCGVVIGAWVLLWRDFEVNGKGTRRLTPNCRFSMKFKRFFFVYLIN